MKTKGATVEVFVTAFRAMPRKEQSIFLSEVLKDGRLRDDVIDIVIAEGRARDKARPFREFLDKRDRPQEGSL